MDKKDVIIQVITTYKNKEGAALAYQADVDYLRKHKYGKRIEIKKMGDASIMLEKKQTDGITYNLLFYMDNVFVAVSAKYKFENEKNIDHIINLAEKIQHKIDPSG